MSFEVVFDPPLEIDEGVRAPTSLEEVELPQGSKLHNPMFEMSYKVHGNIFSYSPASILTVLNDVYLELNLIRSRNGHMMALSGYPVVGVEFGRVGAKFYQVISGRRHAINGPIAVDIVERAFETAARQAWSEFIRITTPRHET